MRHENAVLGFVFEKKIVLGLDVAWGSPSPRGPCQLKYWKIGEERLINWLEGDSWQRLK